MQLHLQCDKQIRTNLKRTCFVGFDLRKDIVRVQFKHNVVHRIFSTVAANADGAKTHIRYPHVDGLVRISGLKRKVK